MDGKCGQYRGKWGDEVKEGGGGIYNISLISNIENKFRKFNYKY